MSRCRGSLLAACLSLTVLLPAAGAHPGFHARTIKCLLKTDGLHLAIDHQVQSGQAARAFRQAWDKNADGRLDRHEQAELLRVFEQRLLNHLRIELDGQAIPARRIRPEAMGLRGPASSVESLRIHLQVSFSFRPKSGERLLVIGARSGQRGVDVPIVLQVGRNVRLFKYSDKTDKHRPAAGSFADETPGDGTTRGEDVSGQKSGVTAFLEGASRLEVRFASRR